MLRSKVLSVAKTQMRLSSPSMVQSLPMVASSTSTTTVASASPSIKFNSLIFSANFSSQKHGQHHPSPQQVQQAQQQRQGPAPTQSRQQQQQGSQPSKNQSQIPQSKDGKKLIFDVTSDNFASEVLQSKDLILLDCYADWCAPCKKLAPVLEKIVKENKSKITIRLAKLNVDVEQQLSMSLRVQSLPTIYAIGNGKLLHNLVGFESEASVKNWVSELVKKFEEITGQQGKADGEGKKELTMLEMLPTALEISAVSKEKVEIMELVPLFQELAKATPEYIKKEEDSSAEKVTEKHRRRALEVRILAHIGLARCALAVGDANEQVKAILDILAGKEYADEVKRNPSASQAIAQLRFAIESTGDNDLAKLKREIAQDPKNVDSKLKYAKGK